MSQPSKNILIWFESPQGTGHCSIVSALCNVLRERGFKVHIASHDAISKGSAFNFHGAEIHALPNYVGSEANGYASALQGIAQTLQPDIFLTEMWPAARREFDDKLKETLGYMKNTSVACVSLVRPVIAMNLSSPYNGGDTHTVSDGLARDSEVARLFAKHYDLVLIRGDANYMPLVMEYENGKTRPFLNGIEKNRIQYVGFFSTNNGHAHYSTTSPDKRGQIFVTCGGTWNQSARNIIEGAVRAAEHAVAHPARYQSLIERPWRIRMPPAAWEDEEKAMQLKGKVNALRGQGMHILLEGYGTDMPKQLSKSDVTVGLAGETLFQSLSYGVPPVAAIMEQKYGDDRGEQKFVMKRLMRNRLAVQIDTDTMNNGAATADAILQGIDLRLQPEFETARNALNFNGASRAVDAIESLLGKKQIPKRGGAEAVGLS